MSKVIVFIQVQGSPGIIEAELEAEAAAEAIEAAVINAGVAIPEGAFLFLDEDEAPRQRNHKGPVDGLKHGGRVHFTHCHTIKVMAHFLDRTSETSFSPGTRVRKVKAWAVAEFKLDHKDAAEHVLQLCNSSRRPPTDTPLHDLTERGQCSVCFDLVPEKRVEG